MRRSIHMDLGIYIDDKEKYEELLEECERFKKKIMEKGDNYSFARGERISVILQSESEGV